MHFNWSEIAITLWNGRVSIQKIKSKNVCKIFQLRFICIFYVDIFSERRGNSKHKLKRLECHFIYVKPMLCDCVIVWVCVCFMLVPTKCRFWFFFWGVWGCFGDKITYHGSSTARLWCHCWCRTWWLTIVCGCMLCLI